jgi:hypothetical protein
MRTVGMTAITTRRDLTGIERFVAGISPATLASRQEDR